MKANSLFALVVLSATVLFAGCMGTKTPVETPAVEATVETPAVEATVETPAVEATVEATTESGDVVEAVANEVAPTTAN